MFTALCVCFFMCVCVFVSCLTDLSPVHHVVHHTCSSAGHVPVIFQLLCNHTSVTHPLAWCLLRYDTRGKSQCLLREEFVWCVNVSVCLCWVDAGLWSTLEHLRQFLLSVIQTDGYNQQIHSYPSPSHSPFYTKISFTIFNSLHIFRGS